MPEETQKQKVLRLITALWDEHPDDSFCGLLWLDELEGVDIYDITDDELIEHLEIALKKKKNGD